MEEHGNTKGTYHLHGNNGNPNGSRSNFRKYGLLFEAMQFFYYFQSVKLIWIYFVTGRSQFFHYVKLYGLIFMHKISTRVVCVNGEHAKSKFRDILSLKLTGGDLSFFLESQL